MADPHRPDPFDVQQTLLANRPVRTVIDAGAYVGDTPVRYATLFPDADVHALEPCPETFARLGHFTSNFPRIRRHQLALSDTSGTRTFHLNGYDPTHSLLPRPSTGPRYYPEGAGHVRRTEVESVSLDEFCARQGIESVDILKMDIQGAELMALRGADGLLRRQAVSVIYTEVAFVRHYEDAPLFRDIDAHLAARGYSLYDLSFHAHAANGQLRYGDALYVADQVRAAVLDPTPAP